MKHLRSPSQFQAVLRGKVLAATQHFVLHGVPVSKPGVISRPSGNLPLDTPLEEKPGAPLAEFHLAEFHLGTVLPKRYARRAVTRNALRRQIYSVGQDFASALDSWGCAVRLRKEFDRAMFPSATSKVLRALARQELAALFAQALRAAQSAMGQRHRAAVDASVSCSPVVHPPKAPS